MNLKAVIGFVAASLMLATAPSVEASRCSDAPWGWRTPSAVVKSGRGETIWFVARALEVERVRLDQGTIPPARQGETIGVRLRFDVLASWGAPLPRRFGLYVSPVSVSTFDGCSPPFRHVESYDPAGIRPPGTWLLAVVRDDGPGASEGYRLADRHQYRPWSEALALRYALGPPDHRHAAVESSPTLDDLAAALDHPEQVRRDDALWFWLSIRCGRDYLRWRPDDLALPDDENVLLRRMTERFSGYPVNPADEAPLPPQSRYPLAMPRKCTAAESSWVAEQIREFKAAMP